jgi:hypothetical protein
MCEDAMVKIKAKKPEIWELERKIEDEEIKKRWASIDNDFLDECEKHREWYLNFTKKEHHPMSYIVNKEVEEWERSAPLFKEFDNMIYNMYYFGIASITTMIGIGIILAAYILS